MTDLDTRSSARPEPEILRRGVQAQVRSARWWALGIVALTLVTVAFWPSVEGTDAFSQLEQTSPELLEAFGAQGLSTPAGYLDGQLYALMLPLLLSALCIATATSLTSGDEDAARLELIHDAVGGFGGSRGRALGIATLVLLAGYVVNFLFPLSGALTDLRVVSPWSWAIGEQPVSDGVSWWWNALLVAATAVVATAGTLAVARRDIRGA